MVNDMAECNVCFRHCLIDEGKTGFCRVRTCKDGIVIPMNYGKVTSIALDPIEKKPLRRFFPGTKILSVGSCGCSLRCPFCQNHEISWGDNALDTADTAAVLTPGEIAFLADKYRSKGNIGVAFTYNEPLVGYEFVRDTAKEVRKKGLYNVLVTSGNAEVPVLDELSPYIDAMNIDLKGFTEHFYTDVAKGDLDTVKRFIERAVQFCHVEITTLIIPGENDSEGEITAISRWIASLKGKTDGKDIPLHISRFFPHFHMTDRAATDVRTIYRLADVARKELNYVYTGNC